MNNEFFSVFKSVNLYDIEDWEKISQLNDTEKKRELEKRGYCLKEKFQTSHNFIHRNIAGSDVLISVGENIANFNGYIQLNSTASFLWDAMKQPKTWDELEKSLQEIYGISQEEASLDVWDFVKELLEHDMVSVQ